LTRLRQGYGGQARHRSSSRPILHTRADDSAIPDDFASARSPKLLKTNEPEKRRNRRQKSSLIVKTDLNPLFLLKNQ
jgi:hypothetical protein